MRLKAKLERYGRLADWLSDTNLITDVEWFEQERLALAARLIELAQGAYKPKDLKAVLDVKPGRGEKYPARVIPKANGRCSLSIRDKQDYLLFVAQVISRGAVREDFVKAESAIAWLIKGLRLIASGADVELSLNVKPKPKEHRSRVKANERENKKNWVFGWLHTRTTDRETYDFIDGQLICCDDEPTWSAEKAIEKLSRCFENATSNPSFDTKLGYTHDTIQAEWKRDRARRLATRKNNGVFRIRSNRV